MLGISWGMKRVKFVHAPLGTTAAVLCRHIYVTEFGVDPPRSVVSVCLCLRRGWRSMFMFLIVLMIAVGWSCVKNIHTRCGW